MALEQELATFKRELPNLLNQAGRYALVKGEKVDSTWDTYRDAIQEGYRVFGLDSFLAKKIEAVETIVHITRDVRPACRSSV
jgi:hypothetical protein